VAVGCRNVCVEELAIFHRQVRSLASVVRALAKALTPKAESANGDPQHQTLLSSQARTTKPIKTFILSWIALVIFINSPTKIRCCGSVVLLL
jgi:hypothetical protein